MDKFNEHDISGEVTRVYAYPDGEYTVIAPRTLYVKKSDPDSHRVVDDNGVAHIPKKGWLAIRFDADGLEF